MRAWWILLLVPLAAGQAHDHGPGSGHVIVSDVGPDGLAYVGSPTHFELLSLTDGRPDPHVDLPVRVTLDGAIVYETTATSGHDYDGIHGFDIVFPRAGAWTVEILGTDASLSGTAIESELHDVGVSLSTATSSPPWQVVTAIRDNVAVPHTDYLLEYLDGDRLLLRSKVHAHTSHATWQEGHVPGANTLRVTAYTAAPEQGPAIEPHILTTAIQTQARPGAPLTAPVGEALVSIGGERTLIATLDPGADIGPDTLQHVQAFVLEGDHILRHMSFDVEVQGPDGLVFLAGDGPQGDGVHEHDGIYELAARLATPGTYEATLRAWHGDWSETVRIAWTVSQGEPRTGVQIALVENNKDGDLRNVTLQATDLLGQPFAHGELDIQLAGDRVLLRDKLHTHADGTFQIRVPTGCQPQTLSVDAFPLEPGFTLLPENAPTFTFSGDNCTWRWHQDDFATATVEREPPVPEAQTTPMPAALLLIGLAVALFARQR